jgi:hypothetical protein
MASLQVKMFVERKKTGQPFILRKSAIEAIFVICDENTSDT